ncbi:MAG TPA: hypothetical protein IAA29_09305 [Candidatus Paenibacillus intestinavium]|nr:hypothetical protein [Candidatus Paenibacillus intestinavium]
MKYTILGFQQDKANNLKLNMNDLLLMRVIKDMYSSAGMEFIVDEGDKYIWVKQDYLHEQIPIIGSKRTMLRIIDNLVELELLDKKVAYKKGKVKGTFFYIKPTTKMDSLQDYDPYDRLSKGGRQIVKRGMTKCHNKDTSITDTSITDNKDTASPKKSKYGDAENVLLTDEEYKKLKDRFPSDYEERINNLSYYIASKGAKYKSHYMTILAWARKDSNKSKKGSAWESYIN